MTETTVNYGFLKILKHFDSDSKLGNNFLGNHIKVLSIKIIVVKSKYA